MRKSLRRTGIALAATAALLLTGCSAASTDTQQGTESGPVDLTYWAWVPNMDKIVDKWNAANPDIHVTYVKVDSGDPSVTKLLTAINAGSGAPDVTQAEYQKIPTLVASNALADISGDIDGGLKDKFSDGVWSSVTLGGDAVYGIPQDSGPMMFYYRTDIFDQLGLSVPTTWDEYAKAAATIHAADPSMFLGTFSSADAGQFAGLTQQAGASWWGTSGDSWSVDIDSDASKKVASFWGGLVQSGVIDNQPQYTPEWNAALNTGKQVGWVGAVWGPGVLSGNAADTAGKWLMAPLPQWDAANPASGNWGGSATAVTSQSKHPAEAAKFMTWLNTSPEAVADQISLGGNYPADTVDSVDALKTPNAFFSNQPDFYTLAAKIGDTVKPFTYGPNVNVAYSAFNDAFGKAAESKSQSAFVDALGTMQQTTVDDLKKNGFTVK